MVKLMRKVLRLNGMDGKIKVINKRSDELQVGVDIPSRADILVGFRILLLFSSSLIFHIRLEAIFDVENHYALLTQLLIDI